MSNTYVSPTGQLIYLPEPMLPVDLNSAAEVWDDALCAQIDPELFFPSRGDVPTAHAAKQICNSCPVQELCLTTFGPVLDDGIVGGLTPRERRGMRTAARQQKKEETAA